MSSKDQNKRWAEDGVNGIELLLQGLLGETAVAGRASWIKTELVVKKLLLVQRSSPSSPFLRVLWAAEHPGVDWEPDRAVSTSVCCSAS